MDECVPSVWMSGPVLLKCVEACRMIGCITNEPPPVPAMIMICVVRIMASSWSLQPASHHDTPMLRSYKV